MWSVCVWLAEKQSQANILPCSCFAVREGVFFFIKSIIPYMTWWVAIKMLNFFCFRWPKNALLKLIRFFQMIMNEIHLKNLVPFFNKDIFCGVWNFNHSCVVLLVITVPSSLKLSWSSFEISYHFSNDLQRNFQWHAKGDAKLLLQNNWSNDTDKAI